MEYNSIGNPSIQGEVAGNFSDPYLVKYKNQYRSSVNIINYHESGKRIADQVSLLNAYPIDIKDIQLNWGDTNQMMIVPVTFTYFDFIDSTYAALQINPPEESGLSLLEKIQKGVSAALVFKSFKKIDNIGDAVQVVREGTRAINSIFKI